jgi:uncharacterized protein YciI
MPHFVLTYVLPADYFERRGPFKDGHMRHIAEAEAGGGLIVAGVSDIPPTGAAYVFDREGAAEAFVHTDPYITGCVVSEWSVLPWTPVVGPGTA